MRAKEFIVETAMMGKIADSGKIIRILKKAHTVPFSDEKNWLLVDTDPGKGNSGLGIKWIPADTRFEWVRPYKDSVDENLSPQTIHKLADHKGVKWDDEPSFLQLTKRLTGKEHLDDLDQGGLNKVKKHLDGLQGVAENFADGRNTEKFLGEYPSIETKLGEETHPDLVKYNKNFQKQLHRDLDVGQGKGKKTDINYDSDEKDWSDLTHVQDYTGGSLDTNDYLHRQYRNKAKAKELTIHQAKIQAMDRILANNKLPQQIVVYTGLSQSPAEAWETYKADVTKPIRLHLPAYTSTTTKLKVALEHAGEGEITQVSRARHPPRNKDAPGDEWGTQILMMTLPAGLPAASVKKISEWPDENEILLPRGIDIEINPSPTVLRDGDYVWHAKVLSHSPVQIASPMQENFADGRKPQEQGVAEGSENNNTTAQKIFFARSNKTPKGWSYDHVGFITQDGKQIQMSGHKGNDVYVTNDVTDDPEFPKQNIKIVSLSKPVSVPTTNSVGAENCGTFVANVLQANGIKGIDTQKIYSVFKKPQEQGVAEGATVTRIDSKPITDFGSSLKAYKHTDDWSQSGVDTGDDSYWKNKNLKTNTTKGLFAGDPRRTALYATGNAYETRYVEFTQNGQPIVYFDQKDLPAMRSRKTYLTVFDAGDFRQLPTGEWFSENPSKPIKQMPIGDPFKYIAGQGWIVRVTDDLGKVFKQVKNMHKAGKIAQYGAEGMNESKQGVAEGLK